MNKEPKRLFEAATDFDDKVAKEEIHTILRALAYQTKNMSGEDLRLLRNYLLKIVR